MDFSGGTRISGRAVTSRRRGARARRSRIFSAGVIRPAGTRADHDQAVDAERATWILVLASERDRKGKDLESLHYVTSLHDSFCCGRSVLGPPFAELR